MPGLFLCLAANGQSDAVLRQVTDIREGVILILALFLSECYNIRDFAIGAAISTFVEVNFNPSIDPVYLRLQ